MSLDSYRGPVQKTQTQGGGQFDSASACTSGRVQRETQRRMKSVEYWKRELNGGRPVCSKSSWRWKGHKEKLEMIRNKYSWDEGPPSAFSADRHSADSSLISGHLALSLVHDGRRFRWRRRDIPSAATGGR